VITEIVGNVYQNGKRIATQKVTYEKSDDFYALANLQRNYESVCEQIANAPADGNTSHLLAEKARLEGEISAQEQIISGYASAAE